jgi:hypothetical protein
LYDQQTQTQSQTQKKKKMTAVFVGLVVLVLLLLAGAFLLYRHERNQQSNGSGSGSGSSPSPSISVPACKGSPAQVTSEQDVVNLLAALSRLYSIASYGTSGDDAVVNALVLASTPASQGDRAQVYQLLSSAAANQQLATTGAFISSLATSNSDLAELQNRALSAFNYCLASLGHTVS